jgi:hypothetical protein
MGILDDDNAQLPLGLVISYRFVASNRCLPSQLFMTHTYFDNSKARPQLGWPPNLGFRV